MTLTAPQLTDLTLTEAAAAIAAGELTPLELVSAYLARIDALEPSIHAWSRFDREAVLAEARACTDEARAGRLRGRLHGVPVGVKEQFDVAGLPSAMSGSQEPCAEDATAVARLRAEGAIVIGKTHMPLDGGTAPTRNPWNLAHTPGASSAGSGAAVAARMVPLALAEQTGGSALRPAAYCGVDALKPTYGRVSRFGMAPFAWSLDHAGIIGLTMEDIALVLGIIAGPDPLDPACLAEPAPPALLTDRGPPRIGVVRNFFPERTGEVMQAAIDVAASRLAGSGAVVVDVRLPEEFGLLWPVSRIINGAERQLIHRNNAIDTSAESPGGYAPFLYAFNEASSLIPASYYLQAQRIRRHVAALLEPVLAEADALLMAATSGPAPEASKGTGDWTLLEPWSSLGHPTITINGGLSHESLPLGLQLVAESLADHRLLEVGAWCEKVLGRLPAPPL